MKLSTINAICAVLILVLLFLAGQSMGQDGLTPADYHTLDSLDAKILKLENAWTLNKRYEEALNITGRLEALTFYRQKNVITAPEQEKMVLNCAKYMPNCRRSATIYSISTLNRPA